MALHVFPILGQATFLLCMWQVRGTTGLLHLAVSTPSVVVPSFAARVV